MGKQSKKQRQKCERLVADLADVRLEIETAAAFVRAQVVGLTEEAERERSALRDLRTARHAVELELERDARASFAEVNQRAVQSLGAFEASLVGLRDRAEPLVGKRMTEILAAAEREMRDARDDARRRIDDAVVVVEQLACDARDDARRRIDDAVVVVEQLACDARDELARIPESVRIPEPVPESFPESFPETLPEPAPAPETDAETVAAPIPAPENFPQPGDDVPPITSPTGGSGTATSAVTATRVAPPQDVGARVPRPPVQVGMSLAALTASAEVLARYAADERARVEVVHVAVGGRSASFLRLTAFNVAGWWEYHDVPATTSSKEPQSAVVDLGELANALQFAREQSEDPEVLVEMSGDLTIGNVLLLDQPGTDPVLPYHRRRIERVDLGAADRSGLHVETQVGRVFVPPRLISFLRSRNSQTADLLMVEDWPCLAAQIGSPSEGTTAMIVARLADEGVTLDESAEERRNAAGSEVEQLVQALSADTTADQLEQILRTGVGYVRRRAAAHPALPSSVIQDLLDVGTEAIRAAAASNPSISEEACALAAADRSEIVRAAMAENRAATSACLELLAADPVPQVRERAAANVHCTRELLTRLAEDVDSSVRAVAAAHPEQDPDVLILLAHDPDPRVCAAVARNPACPGPLMHELLALVPDAVLANPGAPASVLAAGGRVDARQLRAVVAANPATPVKQLQTLARDGDPAVVRAVAENPATPVNVRRRARRRLSSAGTAS